MRAPRFPLHLPVWFRAGHNEGWRETQTENISASGVFVRWTDPLPLDTTVEFRLTLPANDTSRAGGEIAGRGRVARVVETPVERCQSGFAIAIEQYNLHPQVTSGMTRH